MNAKFKLRPATIADVGREVEIFADAKKVLKERNIPQWQDGKYPSQADALSDLELKQSYVLENKAGEIVAIGSVGYAPEELYDDSRFIHSTKYAILHRTVVDSNYGGQGIGKELLRQLMQVAKDNGYHDIRIDTHPLNIAMHKTILNMGFHIIGEIMLPIKSHPERVVYQYYEAS